MFLKGTTRSVEYWLTVYIKAGDIVKNKTGILYNSNITVYRYISICVLAGRTGNRIY